jgi:hypothetical protein
MTDIHLQRHLDKMASSEDRLSACKAKLLADFVRALSTDCRTVLETPEYGERHPDTVAFKVVYDDFSGQRGDSNLIGLLNVVTAAVKSKDAAVSCLALDWVNSMAVQYADFHTSDAE